jgi:hypothetical protein
MKDIQGIELEVGDGVAFNPCQGGTHVLKMGQIEKLTPKGVRITWTEKCVQRVDHQDYYSGELITPAGTVTYRECYVFRKPNQVVWIDGNGRA